MKNFHPPGTNIRRVRLRAMLFLLAAALFSAFVFTQCEPRRTEDTARDQRKTPLDIYVDTTNAQFSYQVMHQSKAEGYTYYVLKMISQQWLNSELVEDPTWWHWVSLVVPETVDHDTTFLWIGGGSRNDELPENPNSILLRTARITNSIAIGVHNIPNQPVTFAGDTTEVRYEDALIAFGWREFLERGAGDEDAVWLARLPMTNAVVKAMDAVTAFISGQRGREIAGFVVAGGSKRGWTTWTTAAVDDRVVAIVPIVIDLLNLTPSFQHHWRNYGFWAPAIEDYVNQGIMEWMGSGELDRLLDITEPYAYISRYDMPKFLINATGDQFFLPDSWQFYWADLLGEKYLRYVPSTGHSLDDTDAMESMIAFYDAVLDKEDLPEYHWEMDHSGISVETDPAQPPREVKLWSAVNEEARDFRISEIGKGWRDSTLTINQTGTYRIPLTAPDQGWKAYFVEFTYSNYVLPLKLTTGVTVLPQEYPFAPYEPAISKGTR